jgi:hypothetical protein
LNSWFKKENKIVISINYKKKKRYLLRVYWINNNCNFERNETYYGNTQFLVFVKEITVRNQQSQFSIHIFWYFYKFIFDSLYKLRESFILFRNLKQSSLKKCWFPSFYSSFYFLCNVVKFHFRHFFILLSRLATPSNSEQISNQFVQVH